ncbi:reverse transcriptase domain-containing protein [Tanacetum coccineum]
MHSTWTKLRHLYLETSGYDRHPTKHCLNIWEGCRPVREKKIGQAPERNKAIQEELEKLVDVEIMKEVHYHSWLSNPVMAKKHDGTWRMCVDFKDLNNACPKDCYPLPEIDWKIESLYQAQPIGRAKAEWETSKSKQEAKAAFKQMKKLIVELPMLTAPKEKDELIIYFAAAKEAICAVLMTDREGKQVPVYFVSSALRGP